MIQIKKCLLPRTNQVHCYLGTPVILGNKVPVYPFLNQNGSGICVYGCEWVSEWVSRGKVRFIEEEGQHIKSPEILWSQYSTSCAFLRAGDLQEVLHLMCTWFQENKLIWWIVSWILTILKLSPSPLQVLSLRTANSTLLPLQNLTPGFLGFV